MQIAAYPTLAAYAEQHDAPDLVDVFRKPSEVVGVVNDAIAAGAKAIWFQYGVINDDAIALADQAGPRRRRRSLHEGRARAFPRRTLHERP